MAAETPFPETAGVACLLIAAMISSAAHAVERCLEADGTVRFEQFACPEGSKKIRREGQPISVIAVPRMR